MLRPLATVLLLVSAGCGPAHRTGGDTVPTTPLVAAPPPEGTRTDAPPAELAVTPERICDRIFALKAEGCGFGDYSLSMAECVTDFGHSLDDRGEAAHDMTLAFGGCLVHEPTCDRVASCVEAMPKPADELRTCDDEELRMKDAAVGVSADDWAHRKGGDARFFREAASTKVEPVEVCGIRSELTWLLGATCDDGTNPYGGSLDRAHASRVGNVGAGGVCASIIDLYEVPCPEGTYSIYIDAYVCPAPPEMHVPRYRTRIPIP